MDEFYNKEFEESLRESIADFKMIPGRRVWYSIYNDMHPGSRWPSLAVAAAILLAILYIGIANNNHINNHSNEASSERMEQMASLTETAGNKNANNGAGEIKNSSAEQKQSTGFVSRVKEKLDELFVENNGVVVSNEQHERINAAEKFVSHRSEQNSPTIDKYIENVAETKNQNDNLRLSDRSYFPKLLRSEFGGLNIANKGIELNKADLRLAIKNIKDNAKFPKIIAAKARKNLFFSYYITPAMGFRNLTYRKYIPSSTMNFAASNLVVDPKSYDKQSFNQSSAFNIETGVSLAYKLGADFRVNAGIQGNFTRYNIRAKKMDHPTATAIMLKQPDGSESLVSRSTVYANVEDSKTDAVLGNRTIQLAIPMGAEMKLLGNKKLKWWAGATIQPTFVLDGKAFVPSYDLNNYVEENSLLRKINVNAGMETYLSYEVKKGTFINAGPQIRKQLFSTYNEKYQVGEKLYSIGVKIGVAKSF